MTQLGKNGHGVMAAKKRFLKSKLVMFLPDSIDFILLLIDFQFSPSHVWISWMVFDLF